jgi:hypothetical protein
MCTGSNTIAIYAFCCFHQELLQEVHTINKANDAKGIFKISQKNRSAQYYVG